MNKDEKWSHRYECGLCGRTFRGKNERDLLKKIKQHRKRNHEDEPKLDEEKLKNHIEK